MKAAGSAASAVMRVLSPRMLPPRRVEDGSTARTATLWPRAVSMVPSRSMQVDFPAPGTPEIPTRCELPAWGSSRTSSSWASPAWSGSVDSTRVMARATCDRSPASTPVTYRSRFTGV